MLQTDEHLHNFLSIGSSLYLKVITRQTKKYNINASKPTNTLTIHYASKTNKTA